MMTSNAREVLQGVETIIIDEIHALVPNKRGAHMALSLERLAMRCEKAPQRDRAFGDAAAVGRGGAFSRRGSGRGFSPPPRTAALDASRTDAPEGRAEATPT